MSFNSILRQVLPPVVQSSIQWVEPIIRDIKGQKRYQNAVITDIYVITFDLNSSVPCYYNLNRVHALDIAFGTTVFADEKLNSVSYHIAMDFGKPQGQEHLYTYEPHTKLPFLIRSAWFYCQIYRALPWSRHTTAFASPLWQQAAMVSGAGPPATPGVQPRPPGATPRPFSHSVILQTSFTPGGVGAAPTPQPQPAGVLTPMGAAVLALTAFRRRGAGGVSLAGTSEALLSPAQDLAALRVLVQAIADARTVEERHVLYSEVAQAVATHRHLRHACFKPGGAYCLAPSPHAWRTRPRDCLLTRPATRSRARPLQNLRLYGLIVSDLQRLVGQPLARTRTHPLPSLPPGALQPTAEPTLLPLLPSRYALTLTNLLAVLFFRSSPFMDRLRLIDVPPPQALPQVAMRLLPLGLLYLQGHGHPDIARHCYSADDLVEVLSTHPSLSAQLAADQRLRAAQRWAILRARARFALVAPGAPAAAPHPAQTGGAPTAPTSIGAPTESAAPPAAAETPPPGDLPLSVEPGWERPMAERLGRVVDRTTNPRTNPFLGATAQRRPSAALGRLVQQSLAGPGCALASDVAIHTAASPASYSFSPVGEASPSSSFHPRPSTSTTTVAAAAFGQAPPVAGGAPPSGLLGWMSGLWAQGGRQPSSPGGGVDSGSLPRVESTIRTPVGGYDPALPPGLCPSSADLLRCTQREVYLEGRLEAIRMAAQRPPSPRPPAFAPAPAFPDANAVDPFATLPAEVQQRLGAVSTAAPLGVFSQFIPFPAGMKMKRQVREPPSPSPLFRASTSDPPFIGPHRSDVWGKCVSRVTPSSPHIFPAHGQAAATGSPLQSQRSSAQQPDMSQLTPPGPPGATPPSLPPSSPGRGLLSAGSAPSSPNTPPPPTARLLATTAPCVYPPARYGLVPRPILDPMTGGGMATMAHTPPGDVGADRQEEDESVAVPSHQAALSAIWAWCRGGLDNSGDEAGGQQGWWRDRDSEGRVLLPPLRLPAVPPQGGGLSPVDHVAVKATAAAAAPRTEPRPEPEESEAPEHPTGPQPQPANQQKKKKKKKKRRIRWAAAGGAVSRASRSRSPGGPRGSGDAVGVGWAGEGGGLAPGRGLVVPLPADVARTPLEGRPGRQDEEPDEEMMTTDLEPGFAILRGISEPPAPIPPDVVSEFLAAPPTGGTPPGLRAHQPTQGIASPLSTMLLAARSSAAPSGGARTLEDTLRRTMGRLPTAVLTAQQRREAYEARRQAGAENEDSLENPGLDHALGYVVDNISRLLFEWDMLYRQAGTFLPAVMPFGQCRAFASVAMTRVMAILLDLDRTSSTPAGQTAPESTLPSASSTLVKRTGLVQPAMFEQAKRALGAEQAGLALFFHTYVMELLGSHDRSIERHLIMMHSPDLRYILPGLLRHLCGEDRTVLTAFAQTWLQRICDKAKEAGNLGNAETGEEASPI
ncbi:hypothetical protein PAPYR_9955 [Paratrimastix pyriformis]|uniref:Uncharacterized protein n=1 Tax=Paratrimastix pyriformis TaxID=342808 RepID=A0ABQ8UEA8_9EUKA|nr:hypothetical protein PAPYR_9955 [Paratrimastix pyriformis]